MKNKNLPRPTETELEILRVLWQHGPNTERDETVRPQIYSTRVPQEQTQKQLVKDLLNRAFGGSVRQMVMQALSEREASDEELEQLEQLLDKFEEKKK
jgi:predicted transcriptional regulator